MNIIAIDCGASFLKAALFRDGRMSKEIHRKAPKVHGEENIFHPVQVCQLVNDVRAILEGLTEGLAEAVVCISNEMHGFLLAFENGMPFTDYISWQKEFGYEKIGELSSKEILESKEYQKEIILSGMPVRAGLPSSNLLYLKRKGYLDRTEEHLYFYTLGDYLIHVITGRCAVCHLTNAAATGLLDISKGEWNNNLLDLVSNYNVRFPEIGTNAVDAVVGGCKLHFLPAIGDQQAALYGAGLDCETDLSFNLGTGAQVSKIMYEPSLSALYQTRPYMNGKFIKSVPHLPSGRAMNVFIRFVQDILSNFGVESDDSTIWDVVLKSVQSLEDTPLCCDLSFFENPLTDHTNGSISNITEYGFDMGSLFGAVFKQMANNFIKAAEQIEPDKSNVLRIVFSGGVAKRIPLIRGKIENYYDGVQVVTAVNDETLFGLYRYAKECDNKGDFGLL